MRRWLLSLLLLASPLQAQSLSFRHWQEIGKTLSPAGYWAYPGYVTASLPPCTTSSNEKQSAYDLTFKLPVFCDGVSWKYSFISWPLLAPNGSAAAPSYSFANDPNTGMFLDIPGAVDISVDGQVALALLGSSIDGGLLLGGVDVSGVPTGNTFAGTDRAAGITNGFGGNVLIRSGFGTGDADGGSLVFQVSPPGTSGTSQNVGVTFLSVFSNSITLGGVDILGTPGATVLAGVDRAAGVTDGSGGAVTIRSGQGTGTGVAGIIKHELAPPAAGTGSAVAALRDAEVWSVSSLADPQTTDITMTGNSGGTMVRKAFSELLTLSTVGTTTDTSANLLPAGAIILAVNTRVTTTITTATTFSVGDPTTAARFSASAGGLTAGSVRVGLQHQQGSVATDAAGPVQTAAAKVRITADVNPGAGAIRIQVWALVFAAPTS